MDTFSVLAGLSVILLIVTFAWQAMWRRIQTLEQENAVLQHALNEQHTNLRQLSALKTLTEAAYNALLIADDEHHVLYLNSTAQDLFSTRNVQFDDPSQSVMVVTRHHELDELITQTLRDNEELLAQVQINGCAYRVKAHIADGNGQRIVALALEDISELQRLGRARRDMVANISHELRTPITSIKLLTDTLLRAQELNSRDHGMLMKMAAEIEVLQQIAQELLDLSMIESGRLEMVLKNVTMLSIYDKVSIFSTERARQKDITITADIAEDLAVLVDQEQIGRVLRNLLHNSIKFTPEGGTIIVTAWSQDVDWVRVRVIDTGMGIPIDERDRIFERFYRGDRARHTEGTGLGLAITKHIISAHGGSIWVEDPPNIVDGASVTFTVPAAEAATAAGKSTRALQASTVTTTGDRN